MSRLTQLTRKSATASPRPTARLAPERPLAVTVAGPVGSPDEWLLLYRERGLPATLVGDKVVLPAGQVAAVHMPNSLGLAVFSWLRSQMFAGPVLVRPTKDRGERWTFLAARNISPKLETLCALNTARAGICAQDTPLILPQSWEPQPGSSWWVSAPLPDRELPLLSAVICGTRTIARQRELAR